MANEMEHLHTEFANIMNSEKEPKQSVLWVTKTTYKNIAQKTENDDSFFIGNWIKFCYKQPIIHDMSVYII